MQDLQMGGDSGAPAFPALATAQKTPGRDRAVHGRHATDSRTPTPWQEEAAGHAAGLARCLQWSGFCRCTRPRQTGAPWVAQGWAQGPLDPSLPVQDP